MPKLATILEETLGAERLMATCTDAAFAMEILASSDDISGCDRPATTSATRHILSVALSTQRKAIIVLIELGKREETLTASVALEAFLVESLAECHDSVALICDCLVAKGTNKTSLLRAMRDDLNATKISDLISRLKLRLVHSRHRSGCRSRIARRSWRSRTLRNRSTAIIAELE